MIQEKNCLHQNHLQGQMWYNIKSMTKIRRLKILKFISPSKDINNLHFPESL